MISVGCAKNTIVDHCLGEWKNGKRHGIGIFWSVDGDRYEGDWIDDKKDGYGVYTYQDGEEYRFSHSLSICSQFDYKTIVFIVKKYHV